MLSIYHWKMLTSYCLVRKYLQVEIIGFIARKCFTSYCFSMKISVRLYQKELRFSCHLLTFRNVKHLSMENVYPILFKTKISVRLYQKGWQFNCHLITGRNVSIYYWKMLPSYCFGTKISVGFYQKRWQLSWHLITGRNVNLLLLEYVNLILF